jgi:hypothetical protein
MIADHHGMVSQSPYMYPQIKTNIDQGIQYDL